MELLVLKTFYNFDQDDANDSYYGFGSRIRLQSADNQWDGTVLITELNGNQWSLSYPECVFIGEYDEVEERYDQLMNEL